MPALFAARPGRRAVAARLGLAALGGVLLTLAQPPVSLWPLVFLGVPLLIHLARLAPASAGWTGWVAGCGFFASGLWWISEAFFVDAARHGWMAPFAILGLAAGLALFWAVPFWLAGRFRLGPGGLAALWTLVDYARSHVLTGFPWALPGYVWIDTPVAQVAALIGPHGLGLLTLLAAGAMMSRRWRAGAVAAAVLLVGAGWVWGGQRLAAPEPERAAALVVRLVQPNVPLSEKWDSGRVDLYFRRLLDATAAPGAPRPDVVIWPETAVPWLIEGDAPTRILIAEQAGGAAVILGARRMREEGERRRWWNSLLLLDPDGAVLAAYDKHHLVPFGEFLPFSEQIADWGLTPFVGGSYSSGPGPQVIVAAGLPAFQPLICYEAVFPHEVGGSPRPDWLVQLTNDGWFGTSAGPWQHLAQARMRAIEQGLPMARAANSGVSAMIDAKGRVVARTELMTAAHLDAALPAALPPTPYSRSGDAPALIFATVFLIFALGINQLLTDKLTKNP